MTQLHVNRSIQHVHNAISDMNQLSDSREKAFHVDRLQQVLDWLESQIIAECPKDYAEAES